MRSLITAGVLCGATIGALAQTQTRPPKANELYGGKRLLDRRYITITGATVDKPGVPQASGPTKLDRRIQKQDSRIDNSVCTGCGK